MPDSEKNKAEIKKVAQEEQSCCTQMEEHVGESAETGGIACAASCGACAGCVGAMLGFILGTICCDPVGVAEQAGCFVADNVKDACVPVGIGLFGCFGLFTAPCAPCFPKKQPYVPPPCDDVIEVAEDQYYRLRSGPEKHLMM